MHSPKLAIMAIVSFLATINAADAGVGNVARDIKVGVQDEPQALESFTTIPMSDLVNGINAMETQTGGLTITARQAPSEATVTVTVTTTPAYCNTVTSSAAPQSLASSSSSAPVSGSATPSISGPAVVIPIPVPISSASPMTASGSSVAPRPVSSGNSTVVPMFGNSTMATTRTISTSTDTSSILSTTTSGSAPATSSAGAPKSNGSDGKNFYGVVMAVVIALTANVALLI